jgi:predicted Zn-dependent protease
MIDMMKKPGLILVVVIAYFSSYITYAQTSDLKEELAKAQTLVRQGNIEGASKIYTGIMANYPDNREAVQNWLAINMKRSAIGDVGVLKQLEELEKSYPNNTVILFLKSFLQSQFKQYDAALTGFEKLTTLQPDSVVNWIGKGQILSYMDRNEEALEAFKKAAALDPKRMDVWSMQADILSSLGRYDEAISMLDKTVELSPDFSPNIYNRACMYCLKGDKANALADLKRAISLNPRLKTYAAKDEDFKSLWDDEDFKSITSQ